MRRLILKSFQCPGDILMLTAAVRDLHRAHPGQFQTDVRTSADAVWENNPHLTRLREGEAGVDVLDMHYPLIHECSRRPYHFIHGYAQYLEQQLGISVPVTQFQGDIHLAENEKPLPPALADAGLGQGFWVVIAGGKYDYTAKWWDPASFQQVVDHFRGRVQFAQCGEAGHWHPRLSGVVDLVGKTNLRDFVRLMYHADGVVCPVTFAMHLAAAVPTRPGAARARACVVIAGGRESPHWEAYPHHQYLHTVGALPCCARAGCWKARCQPVGAGDAKDRSNLCEQPVQVTADLRIPKCMTLITAADVIRRVELFHDGGTLPFANGKAAALPVQTAAVPAPKAAEAPPAGPAKGKISVAFHHGLGDCAHFAHMIPLYVKRGYAVEVECSPDKRVLFEAAGAATIPAGALKTHPWGYPPGATAAGHGRFWQGSKPGHNLSEPPLPDIGTKAALWDEYCASTVGVLSHVPAESVRTADRWLAGLPRPVVLLHTKANTSQQRKSLPDAVTAEFYRCLLDRLDGSLVLLDWDNRVPRLPSYRVRHLDELGPCPTETLLALLAKADLVVGVDSGPLHTARFTDTPAVGVWMPGHYPCTYALPRARQLNVVLAEPTRAWNRLKRIPWRIVEHPGAAFDPDRLARFCEQMLGPPRYLPAAELAADVQLQQFVREWCRGNAGNALSPFADRHRSFDLLLRETARRFPSPTVVETGTIRAEEDWAGAGFATYLLGAFLARRGGRLHSVDLSANHCAFARAWTEVFGPAVAVYPQDSVALLGRFPGPIDVLYLDSLDTTEPGHAEHALRELQAALPRLHERSLVLIDDTPWGGGAWVGKGAKAVPWLLERGWRLLYGGYQALLGREPA